MGKKTVKPPSRYAAAGRELAGLCGIMRRLLSPAGCPWDREQTHRSLLRHLRSEAREVERAVRARDWDNLEEELGDLLLQVVFHAALAEAKGRFSMRDVVRGINSKLVRRHPHVFGDEKLRTSGEVLARWKLIKKEEKRSAAGRRAR